MKKLILGLLLTVGISGVSFAKDITNENEKKDVTKTESQNVKTTEENDVNLLSDCTIVTVFRINGICGGSYGDVKFAEEATGDACNGNEGGIIFNVEKFEVDDCF